MLLPKFFSQQYFSKIISTTAFLRWLLQWHFQNDIHSSISKISFKVNGFVYFRTLVDSSCMTCFDDMFIFKGGSIFDVLCFLVVRILSSFSLSIEMMLPSMFSIFSFSIFSIMISVLVILSLLYGIQIHVAETTIILIL